MNQMKGMLPVIVCGFIVLVIYLVIALCIPFLWTPSYWTAFGFGLFAIAFAIVANIIAINTSRTARGVLYRTSFTAISLTYLIIATIVSICFMALAVAPIWVIVVIQVILAALCVGALVVSSSAASHIEHGEERTQYETAFIKNMRTQVAALEPLAASPEAKRAIRNLAETLKYTDPVSHPALLASEQEIARYFPALQNAVNNQDEVSIIALCSTLDDAVKRRAALALAYK